MQQNHSESHNHIRSLPNMNMPIAPRRSPLPHDFWSSPDSIFITNDPTEHGHPTQLPPQQPQPPIQPHQQAHQQQALGIGWDHAVFNQPHGQQPQQPPSQPRQSPLPSAQDGLYPTPSHQGWQQQNPLHQTSLMPSTPQGFGLPAQYRQVPQYSQGHAPVTYNAPEVPQFQQQFSSPGLYHGQHLSVPDTFPSAHSQSHSPPAPQPQPGHSMSFPPPVGHQNPLSDYGLPRGFLDESSVHPTRQVTLSEVSTATDISGIVGIAGASGLAGLRGLPGVSDVPDVTGVSGVTGVSDQSAMNPLFFGTPQLPDNSLNHSLYVNPSDFDRPEDSRYVKIPSVPARSMKFLELTGFVRPFDYYRNDLQFVVPTANHRPASTANHGPTPTANHRPTPTPNHRPTPAANHQQMPAANHQPMPAATASMGATPPVVHGTYAQNPCGSH